jgi:hypothetical protein
MLRIINLLNILNFVISCPTNPILLFPGLGGSRLIKGNLDIWPPKMHYYLLNYKEWKNTIMCDNNITTLDFGDKRSLDLHSNVPYLVRKNLFEDIMKNDNTYPIPYDFRLIHNKSYLIKLYSKLEKYIESFDRPITCLTHSSGGLVLHYFLCNKSDEWKSKHIKNIINVNVPFGGVIVTLKQVIKNTFYNIIVSRDVLISLGGMIINLPNLNIIKPVLIVDGKENNDYFSYFNLAKEKTLYFNNIEMIESFSKSNNVNTIIVYTTENETPSIISIKNKKAKIIYGPGDGTVPLASLLHPQTWNQNNLHFYHLPNYEHSTVLFSKELLLLINNNVNNNNDV